MRPVLRPFKGQVPGLVFFGELKALSCEGPLKTHFCHSNPKTGRADRGMRVFLPIQLCLGTCRVDSQGVLPVSPRGQQAGMGH